MGINYETNKKKTIETKSGNVNSSEPFKTSLTEITLKQRKNTLMTNIIYLKCAGWTAFGLGMKQ